ncbi:IS3 family transposase, partial [Metapseudomonas otitidis]|uniref:IS3 family transposase n=1 Tax=Metapseudomonas otitidis TaxID=319939 RepID=UPI002449FC75
MPKRYDDDFKDWAVQQMMPPLNRSVAELASAIGVTPQALRDWRQMARDKGLIVPGNNKTSDQWSSADKFNVVIETAPLSEVELSQYCRIKGIFPEQIQQWRLACQNANTRVEPKPAAKKTAEQQRIKELERKLLRAEAGRAEAEALLDLRKKAKCDLGQGQGRLISAPDRIKALRLIANAVLLGARRFRACSELGLSLRTAQRWQHVHRDRRQTVQRAAPSNKLSEVERQAVLDAANQPGYASLTPHQIVPKLADEGIYLASESTFYRVLKAANQNARRGRAKASKRRVLTTHRADAPNQVWCWDITWLPSTVKGRYFYWYMVKDIYSRKLVANEVHEIECAEHARDLLEKGCLRERTAGRPLVLHSDNGNVMRGSLLRESMISLGIEPSFSRPRVSNDNAYAEALFRTAKYCPLWPDLPFDSVTEARLWVQKFVDWYNEDHRHSALKYVTPNERHDGKAIALLRSRAELYEAAKAANPGRWSGRTRNWSLADSVYLNPER